MGGRRAARDLPDRGLGLPLPTDTTIDVHTGGVALTGTLIFPPRARGVVVFAHGSGSGRRSPRNRAVADALVQARLATLLIDLLTHDEDAEDARTARLRFDIELLGERVIGAIDWLDSEAVVGDLPPSLREMPVGCYGASTGAAAALIAAAERPDRVRAVVSRGGRPDLASEALPRVTAPTLLIIGSDDLQVIRLNRYAQCLLGGESRVEIVPGAGHLFAEPGALERVTELTREWFVRYLAAANGDPR